MIRFPSTRVCLLLLGAVCALGLRAEAKEPQPGVSDRAIKDVVVISLRPNLQTDSRVIRLVDIANINGGDAALRERIKQLDIEDSLAIGESVTILPSQIEFRLRIAGIDLDRTTVRGTSIRVTAREGSAWRQTETDKTDRPNATASAGKGKVPRPIDFSSISFEEGPLEREIIQSAKDCILSKLPWAAENVECRLLQSIAADLRQVESSEDYDITSELRSSGAPVGRVQVFVHAEAPRRPTVNLNLSFEVRHFDRIVVAAKPIERGHQIIASDVYLDRQDVTDLPDYSTKLEEIVGLTARRSLRALLPMRMNDLDTKSRTEGEVVIRRRDQIKMVARLGNLSVIAMGEAMQDGRVGETIRLRNIESNANIQGRVVAQGEVDISF